jgi:transposase
MGRKRNKYPREFKLEAVKQLDSGEYTLSDLARRLGIRASDLCTWQKEVHELKQDAFPGHGRRSGAAAEVERLRRELEQVKEERDILKKAMAFFARESR